MRVTTDGLNIFSITSSGIDIRDLGHILIGRIPVDVESTSLTTVSGVLYIGTTLSGVLATSTDRIDPSLYYYENNALLQSPYVVNVCASGDYVGVLTSSGIDVYNDINPVYTHAFDNPMYSIQLSNGDFYYTSDAAVYNRVGETIYTQSTGQINGIAGGMDDSGFNILLVATSTGAVYIKDVGGVIETHNIYTEE